MSYKALDVAKALLFYANEEKLPITNLHLQKMLYYAQGFSYTFMDQELFPENIYAWKYGPVIPEVYQYYKSYVSDPITPEEVNIEQFDSFSNAIIKAVAQKIGGMDPWKLVKKTHQELPWKKNFKEFAGDIVIPKKDIQDYFVQMRSVLDEGERGRTC